MSSGTRKPKYFNKGRNIHPSETSPFSLMFNQLTPLMSNAHDKNIQMYSQHFRTEKQDLHDAKVKINNLQMYIGSLKNENRKIKEKFKKVRRALENANAETYRAYDQSKFFSQKIHDIVEEHKKNTSYAETLEALVKAQNWMLDSLKEVARSAKKDAKGRVVRFKQDLHDYKIKLKNSYDSLGFGDPTASLNGSKEIKSKEFSRSGEENDYIPQEKSQLLDLKIRLLSEEEDTEKIEIEPNPDEGFIGENSVLEPLNKNHQDSQKTNEPIIPENELSFLNNSD